MGVEVAGFLDDGAGGVDVAGVAGGVGLAEELFDLLVDGLFVAGLFEEFEDLLVVGDELGGLVEEIDGLLEIFFSSEVFGAGAEILCLLLALFFGEMLLDFGEEASGVGVLAPLRREIYSPLSIALHW